MNNISIPPPFPAELWIKIIDQTDCSISLRKTCKFFSEQDDAFFAPIWSKCLMSIVLYGRVQTISKTLPLATNKEKVQTLYADVTKAFNEANIADPDCLSKHKKSLYFRIRHLELLFYYRNG